jgi:AsmA protein
VGLGIPVVMQGPWRAPSIYPDMAGILDNPEATYAKLREMGKGLFGAAGGGSTGGLPGGLPGGGTGAGTAGLADQLGGKLGETLGALIQQGLGASRGPGVRPPASQTVPAPQDPPPEPNGPDQPSPMDDVLKQLFGR